MTEVRSERKGSGEKPKRIEIENVFDRQSESRGRFLEKKSRNHGVIGNHGTGKEISQLRTRTH